MILDIPSHGLSAFNTSVPHVLEIMPSGSIVFRVVSPSVDTVVHATSPNGAVGPEAGALEPSDGLYTFTPADEGPHTIALTNLNGATSILRVYAFTADWLNRIQLPAGVQNQSAFDDRARLILRSVARLEGLPNDGSFDERVNLANYGAASGVGVHRSELPA